MGPLLSIKTIPFQYELRVNDARFEIENPQPSHTINRQRGGFEMQHTPSKIHIDSTAARASMGLIGIGEAVQQIGDKGMQAAFSAAGQYAQEGNQMMDIRNRNAIPNVGVQRQRAQNSIETMLGFIPSTTSEVSFDTHHLQMQYEMDKLSFDWRTNSIKPDAEFVPASIELKIKDYARLEIEYLGGPIYAPPSSDPNYQPPPYLDVKG